MSGSFADQLLKAGLVSEDDVTKAEADKRRRPSNKPSGKSAKRKPRRGLPQSKAKHSAPQGVANKEARKAHAAANKVSEAEREKRAKQEQAEQRRLLNIQLLNALQEQAIEEPATDPEGKVKFNYPYEGKIRGIYVTAEQQQRLADGELVITLIKAKTKMIPKAAVASVLEIDPDRFIYEVPREDPDDPYKDYAVPDDLVW
ncbi:conserved hypothetical protein [gamma proteobacterium HTCC5015]|nr:conserved hypothetical protein [gamma proteobacterium HTCC5015]